MGRLRFADLQTRPTEVLDLSSVTVDEFQQKDQAIISTACPEDIMINIRPVCEFLGHKSEGGDHWTYWSIGAVALKNMLIAAGFTHIINERHFTLVSEPGYRDYAIPHVVVTGLI
jgi:hypothetical protein